MRNSRFLFGIMIILCGFISPSCSTPPASTPIPIVEKPNIIETPAKTFEPTPLQVASPSYRTQISISTTSDWTAVRLTSGGTLHDINVTSFSEEALSAGLEGESIVLSQSLVGLREVRAWSW